MQKIKQKWLEDETILKQNKADIEKANAKMLSRLLWVGITSFSLLLFVSFFEASYHFMRATYFVILLILLSIYAAKKMMRNHSVLFLLYVGYITLIAICTYVSVFILHDTTSVIVLLLLIQVPIVILDSWWRVNLVEVIAAIVYMILIVMYKDKEFIIDELINTMITVIIAMMLGVQLRRSQITNFELNRRTLIRERTDTLTGLYNRRKLFEDLLAKEKAETEAYAILMLDIDYFKQFNDTYGHISGDTCLKQVGEALLLVSKNNAIRFYRYGGEEFIGVIALQDDVDSVGIAQKTIQSIEDLAIYHKASKYEVVTASAGLSYVKSALTNYEEKLKEADIALYKAKELGKNQVFVYE